MYQSSRGNLCVWRGSHEILHASVKDHFGALDASRVKWLLAERERKKEQHVALDSHSWESQMLDAASASASASASESASASASASASLTEGLCICIQGSGGKGEAGKVVSGDKKEEKEVGRNEQEGKEESDKAECFWELRPDMLCASLSAKEHDNEPDDLPDLGPPGGEIPPPLLSSSTSAPVPFPPSFSSSSSSCKCLMHKNQQQPKSTPSPRATSDEGW